MGSGLERDSLKKDLPEGEDKPRRPLGKSFRAEGMSEDQRGLFWNEEGGVNVRSAVYRTPENLSPDAFSRGYAHLINVDQLWLISSPPNIG